MGIEQYIPVGSKNAIKREDLRLLSQMQDREMRRAIDNSEELIINMQDGRGYFIPEPEDYHLVCIWESTNWKRIRSEMERVKKAAKWKTEREKECDMYCPGIEEDDQVWV